MPVMVKSGRRMQLDRLPVANCSGMGEPVGLSPSGNFKRFRKMSERVLILGDGEKFLVYVSGRGGRGDKTGSTSCGTVPQKLWTMWRMKWRIPSPAMHCVPQG
jgi:hypothetical protein